MGKIPRTQELLKDDFAVRLFISELQKSLADNWLAELKAYSDLIINGDGSQPQPLGIVKAMRGKKSKPRYRKAD